MKEERIILQKGERDIDKGYRLELAIQFRGEYSTLIRDGSVCLTLSNQALMALARAINERFPLDALSQI